ncbi:hypothetical protein V1512DRAFT_212533 [Lipomyces arxii]|uniref:uncharacterized protein n=1 Tax=Lipomyces arxii TaxID=56418 RepID=UPI0034CF98FC
MDATQDGLDTEPFGLLSRSIVHSPVVQSISLFRFSPGQTGILFVKQSSIELDQLYHDPVTNEYELKVIHKTDLFGKILSSAVLPCKVVLPIEYNRARDLSLSADADLKYGSQASDTDTLVLITQDRNLLFATFEATQFIVTTCLKSNHAAGTKLKHIFGQSREEFEDYEMEEYADGFDSDDMDDDSISDEDPAARIKALGKSVDIDPL